MRYQRDQLVPEMELGGGDIKRGDKAAYFSRRRKYQVIVIRYGLTNLAVFQLLTGCLICVHA